MYDAEFQLTRIVSGVGTLNAWASLIVTNPDAEIVPGVKARNAAVRPETNAGADAVLAAFRGGRVVRVSFSCAWYDDGVTSSKVAEQESKSDLKQQFQSAKAGILLA